MAISQRLVDNYSLTIYGQKGLVENDDTELNRIYDYFTDEYLGSTGGDYDPDSSDLTAAQVTDVLDSNTYWNDYISGGDPFGFHKVSASAIAQALAQESGDGLIVIWRLFDKLIELLQAIQGSTIALAEGALYTTKTQRAFTDKMALIDPGVASAEESSRRQQQIENLRGFRTAERDASKQWTSAMNASNDASQGQTSILTTIMQQMSGLISAIFR